jgi:hypothetical protein
VSKATISRMMSKVDAKEYKKLGIIP